MSTPPRWTRNPIGVRHPVYGHVLPVSRFDVKDFVFESVSELPAGASAQLREIAPDPGDPIEIDSILIGPYAAVRLSELTFRTSYELTLTFTFLDGTTETGAIGILCTS